MPTVEPTSFITAVSDAISKLFGRPAWALLGMSLVFFLLPVPWLATIGINRADPTWKTVAGVGLIAGAVMSAISIAPAVARISKMAFENFRAIAAYRAIPMRARFVLILNDLWGETSILLEPEYDDIQALLDQGLVYHHNSRNGVIHVQIGKRGKDFIRRFRAKLRRDLEANPEIADVVGKQLQDARIKFLGRL